MANTRNEGRLPDECVVTYEDGVTSYRAVHVRLHGGYCTRKAGAAPWPPQGIEAGTGETAQQARSQRDESPVPEGDAPNA